MMLDVDILIKEYGYITNIQDFIQAVNNDTDCQYNHQLWSFIDKIVCTGRKNGDLCTGVDIIDTMKDDIKYRQENNLLKVDELQDDIDSIISFSAKGYNDTTYIFDNDCTIEDNPNDMEDILEYYKDYME